jgi:hypothetical protein
VTLASRHRPATELVFKTSSTESTTMSIALRQVTNPARISLIQQQLGLDAAVVILEGRLIDPLRRPEALVAGRKAPLTWAGKAGTARLEPYQGAITATWRDRYGDKLLLSWEATT